MALLAWPCSDWNDLMPSPLAGLCGCGFGRPGMSPDGRFLSFIGGEDDVSFYDLERIQDPYIYRSSSGNTIWLHRFSDDGRYFLWNNRRLLLSSPYHEEQEEKPATSEMPNAEREKSADTMVVSRQNVRLNLMAEEHGEAFQCSSQISKGEAQDLFRRGEGFEGWTFGECTAVDPDGSWGLAKTRKHVVAFALGGTDGYLGRVVDALIPVSSGEPLAEPRI
jgi:hypothetical protein